MLHVWSLAIIVIATINSVSSKARNTVSVTEWKKCATTDNKLMTFYKPIPLKICVNKCSKRASCVGVNYWIRSKSCDLLGNVTGFVPNDESEKPCVHVSGLAIEDARVQCNCAPGMMCNQNSSRCVYKECPVQHVQNGVVHGNMQAVGSKAIVVCQDGAQLKARVPSAPTVSAQLVAHVPYVPIVCGKEGMWTNVPTCAIACTEPPSRFDHTKQAVGEGLLPGNRRAYHCKPGYSTTNNCEGAFTITCQSNLTWSEPTTYCKASGGSDDFSLTVGSQRLYFSDYKLDNGGARELCSSLGGDLIKIDTAEKQANVTEYILENCLDGSDYWIQGQLTDTWYFKDGSEVIHLFWAPGKPSSGGNKKCIRMQRSEDYKWNDRECDKKCYFICERFD